MAKLLLAKLEGFVENGVKDMETTLRHGSERWIEDGFGKEKSWKLF